MRAAVMVFGTEIRAHLIRYFLRQPGPQKDAAEALGVARKTVSEHVAVLLDDGVLYAEPSTDKRSAIFHVNVDRLRELLAAVPAFFFEDDPRD